MITTGQRFAGYELQELVAQDETGSVYRAREVRLQRWVALRIVAPDVARDPVTRARLNRESTLLASLDHPNVAPIYDAGEHDGRLFIATRWVDGSRLHTLVKERGALEPRRAVRIIIQVASALQAAHDLGIIHRNVKPTSVLVTATDLTYLTDFALARRTEDMSGLTRQHDLVESYDYVAPEFISGGQIDARVDIYGLGCVLYEALTAELPYPRSSSAARIYAHLQADPPSPRSRNADVPEKLDSVIMRAMAKDPAERQQTAAEFAIDAAGAVDLSAPLWARRTSTAPPGPLAPAPEGPAAARHEGDFSPPVYFVDRRLSPSRVALWMVGALLFVAAPVALLIAVLS